MHSKFSICAYIFSYYAIAISWILTVANFFLIGLGRKLQYCEGVANGSSP